MRCQDDIPPSAGVGLKAQHYEVILRSRPDIGWFEIHAENYMGEGGPPHHFLEAIREFYPLSLHGVGLSIGADGPLDKDHLNRLKTLNERYRPGLFSEHLAWSTHEGVYFNDLLPVPYTEEAADRVSDHINEVQDVVGRRLLLENPSTYLTFADSTMDEVRFLELVTEQTAAASYSTSTTSLFPRSIKVIRPKTISTLSPSSWLAKFTWAATPRTRVIKESGC